MTGCGNAVLGAWVKLDKHFPIRIQAEFTAKIAQAGGHRWAYFILGTIACNARALSAASRIPGEIFRAD
jgi:hypothetical protein